MHSEEPSHGVVRVITKAGCQGGLGWARGAPVVSITQRAKVTLGEGAGPREGKWWTGTGQDSPYKAKFSVVNYAVDKPAPHLVPFRLRPSLVTARFENDAWHEDAVA